MLKRKTSHLGGNPTAEQSSPPDSKNRCYDNDDYCTSSSNTSKLLSSGCLKWSMRFIAVISFISLNANTPVILYKKVNNQYKQEWTISICILFVDTVISIIYTAECVAKIRDKGLLKGERPYLKDKWCRFDGLMALFHWVSVVIQALQMSSLLDWNTKLLVIRVPRVLIFVRPLRIYLKFRLPKTRIKNVFRRSGQQIWNVTMFLLFFLSLYGLVGVQFFGALNHHCVSNKTFVSIDNFTVNDFMIPDTHCSNQSDEGYQCPPGFLCRPINLKWDQRVYNGFDHFAYSVFTVYEGVSQEGWIFIMFKTLDSMASWKSYIYFFTLIFFLGWLVKNVFIAVVIETFAELRVQFQQIWGSKGFSLSGTTSQILCTSNANNWMLVTMDVKKHKGAAPAIFYKILQSSFFHLTMLFLVFVDAILAASHFYGTRHNKEYYESYKNFLYYCQLLFTIIFDLEMIFKVACLGFAGYIKRGLHKLECVLAFGSTLRFLPYCYHSQLTYFQVLRVVRLIKISPITEEFVFKIFGPGKKLGTLIMFTMFTLILMSSVSLQLFCHIKGLKHFETFPQAFMAMFQILTQEGWVEVMDLTIWKSGEGWSVLVASYFVFYHLFATLIVLCLFVAVILDNLELDEDVKRIKQLKAREQKVESEDKLPVRLAIYDRFPNRPQMVEVSKLTNDFSRPKVRDSFIRNFTSSGFDVEILFEMLQVDEEEDLENSPINNCCNKYSRRLLAQIKNLSGNDSARKHRVLGVVRLSQKQRDTVDSTSIHMLTGALVASAPGPRFGRRSGSGAKEYHGKENGYAGGAATLFTSPQPIKSRDMDIKVLQEKTQQAEIKRSAKEEDLRENHAYFDSPLFIVGRESKLRRICIALVASRFDPRPSASPLRRRYQSAFELFALMPYLDWLMILVTSGSCFSMMFETPQNRVMENHQLQVVEYLFVFCMTVELILKVIANGLLFTPNALIKDFSGFLDALIYFVSLVFVLWLPTDVPAQSLAHHLMVLRCLRPLRIFILIPDLRRVVYELLKGFKEIFLVSVILVALMFIFASFGVQMFAGLLYRCNDPTIKLESECVGNFRRSLAVVKYLHIGNQNDLPSMLVPRVWGNPRNFNFDDLPSAMLCLFEMLTLKGWYEVRDVIMMQTGAVNGLYVHTFVFIGCLIGVTLFIGVIIANFQQNNGRALLTVDQRRWEDLKRRLSLVQPLHIPRRPKGHGFQAKLYDTTQHDNFNKFTAFLLVCQSALLFFKWHEGDRHMSKVLATGCVAFNVIFFFEVCMKVAALSASGYWQSKRNRCDLLVTVLGLIWSGMFASYPRDIVFSLGAILTMFRFLTITGKHATLKMLLLTVLVSMYKSFFIILSLFLLILVYALSGVLLFGAVKPGENLHRHTNFRTAPQAMSVLFRIVTGEDWNKIMHDCMIQKPLCKGGINANYWETDCGNPLAAITFFCSFYVILAYIVLNLLVAIIVENFSLFYSNEEDALLSYADIKHFQQTWNIVDDARKGCIQVRRVRCLLRLLKGRLEVDLDRDKLLFKHMCCEIERLHGGGDVTFHDVLSMLSYRSVDIRKVLQLEELLEREELEYNIEEEVAKQTIRNWMDKCIRKMRSKEKPNLLLSLRNQIEEVSRYIPTSMTATSPQKKEELDKKSDKKRTKSGLFKKPNKDADYDMGYDLLNVDCNCHIFPVEISEWWRENQMRSSDNPDKDCERNLNQYLDDCSEDESDSESTSSE